MSYILDVFARFGVVIALMVAFGGWALLFINQVARSVQREWLDYRDERAEHFRRIEELMERRIEAETKTP